tara:strand:- start:1659 stop:3443 length:1785 start_codon:yes stop_codon:yes gene_type:complete
MHISFKQDNIKTIEKFHPEVFELINNFSSKSSLDLKTEKSRSGEITLSALTKDQSRIYLHSKYDPLRESEKIIAACHLKKTDSDILILGFGLGYLPLAMLDKLDSDKNLYILEPSIEVFLCGIEHINLSTLLNRPNTKLFIGPGFLNEIKNRFSKTDFKTVFFTHQPSLQLFSELNEAKSYLEQITLPKLDKELNYLKFKSGPPRALFFEAGFFIEKELKNTFTHLGFPYRSVNIDSRKREGQSQFIRNLLDVLIDFKPDFIFSVNQWGFDVEGKLAEILTHYEIPFVCWYVDNPLPLLMRNNKNASQYGFYLSWDDYYIDQMKELGFPNVEYLPYAADSTIFYPSSHSIQKKYPVAFVGNSLNNIIETRLKEINNESYLIAIYNKLTKQATVPHPIPSFKGGSSVDYETIDLIKKEIGEKNIPDKYLSSLEVAVNSKWTQERRVGALMALEEFKPHVFGDNGWKELLPPSFHFHSEVNYHKKLPEIYRSTEVNLNISNVQLKNSVNQRLFDVCACGSFLLTDRSFAVQRFLTPGESVETFETYKELRKKVEHYLNYPEKQEAIAKKGCKIILEQHTYEHRIKEILSLLKNYFA